MESESESLTKFKEFIDNWHTNNGLEESQLVYGLFMKLGEEKYNSQSFLEIASDFIEDLRESLDNEGKKKWGNPFQKACISYLLEEMPMESQEVKERIDDRLQHIPQNVTKNILLKLIEDVNRVNRSDSGEELTAFLQLFKEHINAYNESLRKLNQRYVGYKRAILLYALQLFGAIQEFTITRHMFKNIDNDRGGNYLLSPSHSHYLIRPKETIFILIRTSLGAGGAPDQILKKS